MVHNQTVIYQVNRDDLRELITQVVQDAVRGLQGSEDNTTPVGLLTKKEVMAQLHVTAMTLHRWDKSGYLPMKHVGRKVFYSGTDVERVLKNK